MKENWRHSEMKDEILEHQPIDNNALITMELYQTGMADTGSEWLSILSA